MGLKIEDINISIIHEYVSSGKIESNEVTDPAIPKYLELLDKVRGMYNRIDEFGHKEAIMKHLIKVEGLSRYQANNIYNDALEYFYCDKQVSKDAWRNILAQDMRKNYIAAIQMAKTTSDIATANKILVETSKILQLDLPDPVEVDDAAYTQPFKMYSVDAEFLGLPKIDRRELAKQIEALPEMSEKEIIRLKQEANVLPLKLFPDEHEDPRKS
ncbi:hypothetical protein JJL45_05195 [Tamlana sp. s12]|uniref:hypothetical protein n=1 Tax=Tamlana sp. s12 TaxID=1630406 RepID=UPI0008023D1F|nr:hypothetical protein [Tamlana sp. s12]OBQ56100.1 hypothetical protein VQ01_06865 [Tamlana sp. s12]QQY83387.1 hypothetical protein JJL45_05195 [Tamlana sp. s12]